MKGLARENLENYSISSLSVGINSSPVHVKRLELIIQITTYFDAGQSSARFSH